MTAEGFVGRRTELASLSASLRRGGWVAVLGEAGTGKSRLVSEAATDAHAAGAAVLVGRCSALDRITPGRPFAEALLAGFRAAPRPVDPNLQPYLPAVARFVPHWRRPDDGPGESPAVTGESILRVLSSLGPGRPAVVVLEDLHRLADLLVELHLRPSGHPPKVRCANTLLVDPSSSPTRWGQIQTALPPEVGPNQVSTLSDSLGRREAESPDVDVGATEASSRRIARLFDASRSVDEGDGGCGCGGRVSATLDGREGSQCSTTRLAAARSRVRVSAPPRRCAWRYRCSDAVGSPCPRR